MSQPTLESFFTAGGGRSVSWKNQPIGAQVSGVIEAVHPPQQVTDPVDGKPKFKRDGVTPITQVRIDLQTDFRNWEMTKAPDSADEVDDGRRALYVGGWMKGAIGDALRKAGVKGAPQVGGKLWVRLTERTPPDNPALNPTNKFEATYEAPSAAATDSFFGNGDSAPAAPAAAPEPVRPAAISEAAWAQMPLEARRSVAATMGGQDTEPPF